jgi:hypothetical protein
VRRDHAAGVAVIDHDDEDDGCACWRCNAVRDVERANRMREAMRNGGLRELASVWFGPHWLGEGETMDGIDRLAQKTLGDVFEQLGKVAAIGRTKCRGSEYVEIENAPPVTRAEMKALLDYVELALPFATTQLSYLRGPRFCLNDRVIVRRSHEQAEAEPDRTHNEAGSIVGTAPDGRLRVRLDVGGYAEAAESELVGAAQ